MRVEQWPVATRGQVVGAFKNLADETSSESPFRTLRHRGWATSGTRLQTRRDGQIAGGVVIYSSLNVDAARLARLGFEKQAMGLAAEALKVERSRAWERMVGLLAAGTDREARDAVSGIVRHSSLSGVLRTVTRSTERARARYRILTGVYELTVGSVSESWPGYVIVHTTRGDDTAVPRWLAAGVARDKPGDLVAVLHERLGARKALLEAIPAIDVDDPDDTSDYSPFDRADPRNRLSPRDAPFLSGKPTTLRVLVPVTIGR